MPRLRLFLVPMVVAAAFAGGALSGRIFARDAHAESRPTTATEYYVPADGLVFRGADGKTIARLSSDVNGGVLELYTAQEQPGARLRTAGVMGAADFGASASQPAPAAPPAPRVTTNRRDLGS